MSNRLKSGILTTVGLVCVLSVAAYAADGEFAGNWKGDSVATPPPTRGAAGAAAPGGDAAAGTTPSAPTEAAGATGGGGRPGGRPGGGGAFGGGGGGNSSKISLNLKQSKDNKLSGNITVGGADADDVKDGKVEGNRMTFSAGRAPQPIYAYTGEIKGDQLLLTRIAPAGGRGSRTTEYVLTKKK